MLLPNTPAEVDQLTDQLRHSLSRLLQRGARLFAKRTTERLHHLGYVGLSFAHTALLAHIDHAGTYITILASRAGMTKQSMSQLIGELEALGYVCRMIDSTNHRATLVLLTEAGGQLLRDMVAIQQEIEAASTTILGADGIQFLQKSLALLLDGHL